jgi:hypothetical protein
MTVPEVLPVQAIAGVLCREVVALAGEPYPTGKLRPAGGISDARVKTHSMLPQAG